MEAKVSKSPSNSQTLNTDDMDECEKVENVCACASICVLYDHVWTQETHGEVEVNSDSPICSSSASSDSDPESSDSGSSESE